MPISSESYQNLPVKGDPLIQALLPGIESGMRLRRLPKQLDTELLSKQLENALNQIGLQFAPQRQQADLENVLAGTEFNREKTRFMPLDMAISGSNAERANSRFGAVYQMSNALKNMSPAAQAAFIAQNPEAYTQMLVGLSNAAASSQEEKGNDFLSHILSQYFPTGQGQQGGQQSSNRMPSQLPPNKFLADHAEMFAQLPDLLAGNSPNKGKFSPIPLGFSGSSPSIQESPLNSSKFSATPENVKQIKLAEQIAANKALATNSAYEQSESAIKLDNWLAKIQPEFSRVANNVAKYSGVVGKGKKFWDSISKKDPQAYQDYLWLKGTQNTTEEALITQMEKTSTTHEQQIKYEKMLTDAYDRLDTDPATAVILINRLFQTLNDVSEQRVNVGQPIFKNTAEEAFGYKGIPDPYVIDEQGQQNLEKAGIAQRVPVKKYVYDPKTGTLR